MKDRIYVMIKEPGDSSWERREVDNDLKAFQALVGGRIQTVQVSPTLVMLVNEEGVLQELEHNLYVCGHWLRGTVVAVGVDGDSFTNCPLVSPWQMRIAIGIENSRAARKGRADKKEA